MAFDLVDFADIVAMVMDELKLQSSDTTSKNRIKRDINAVYLDEIVPFKRWYWLSGKTDIEHKGYTAAGTASVTPNSTTVTLSVAPTTSKTGFLFATDSYDEIYTIASHTANSTTVTLNTPYTSALNPTVKYKIWTDSLNLPTDCRETIEVWHDFYRQPMEAKGLQEFRRITSEGNKAEGRPFYYATYDFKDPSTGDGESESDRYRLMKLHPAINRDSTTVHIDYVKEATALDVDGDEPLMPLEDRIVVVYGALARAWGRERNPEESTRNFQLFQNKLGRMASRMEDGFDKPQLVPDSSYLVRKRGPRVKSLSRRLFGAGFGGGSSYTSPTFIENPEIRGAHVTDDITVDPGILIDGRDISADGLDLDAHIAATAAHGTVGNIVGTSDLQTLTNKTIPVASNTISGTADSVAQFSSIGVLQPSPTISVTELTYLDDVNPLTTVALNDNQVAIADVAVFSASFTAVQVEYSIVRGAANVESGLVNIVNDGTNASMAQGAIASLGTIGVTLSVDVAGGTVRLRYTSTSTGTAPSFKYKTNKWAA